ncbi:hypothetical protein MELA_01355 [Candidatus Methylomirabilis lanthanidiphila]|uniref:Uncharacterized protein n=1 Tax=Candidatus Methylomirabilis lanthanidiphila TaxID=2211376 RepID=A0A564ZI07_9BACT|nr:hypothetical protein [Candidatus Methylomirabilis lanthanidiphila]VUZ84980.1 hypothetical protein MELA_01355 [Candidatus Methylomirabilis lanthanidiphila]
MKTLIATIVVIVVLAVGGYVALPILIRQESRGLKSDVSNLQQRLDNIEQYLREEEAAKKTGQLPDDAGAKSIIKAINTMSAKVSALEESYKKELSAVVEELKQHKVANEEALRRHIERLEKIVGEVRSNVETVAFKVAMATIRDHLTKVQMELKSKNVGTAKTEMDFINDVFEKTRTITRDDQRKAVEELQEAVRKAGGDMDRNLPAAIDRVDLLWHEVGRLIAP